MKYLIILIIFVGGSYYYQQNLNDCETEYDVRDKIYETVERLNKMTQKMNISNPVTYYDIEQKLDEARRTFGDDFTPKMACYSLDATFAEMEAKFAILLRTIK